MRPLDHLLLWLGTPAILLGVAWGAVQAAPSSTSYATLLAGTGDQASPTYGATASQRLPAGVTIDPETLELVGLQLAGEDGSRVLEWSTLRSYEYQEGLVGVPDEIQALDGQKVTMAGFLLPLYEFDDIKEFNLVASHWSCCFGVPPGINGWVYVHLAPGQPGLRNSTEPLKITGTFRVGEQKEAGYVVSIYAIEDAKATVIGW